MEVIAGCRELGNVRRADSAHDGDSRPRHRGYTQLSASC